MHKVFVPALSAAMVIGSLVAPVEAASIAVPASVAGHGSDLVKVGLICGPGRHLGPLGRCRANGASPIFSFRKSCTPGFHRNFVGLCRRNR